MAKTRTIEDWDVPERLRVGLGAPLGGPLAVIGILAVVLGVAISPLVGIVVDLVLGGAFLAWTLGRGKAVLRSLGARPLNADDEPRPANLVAGKAADLGTAVPTLWLIPGAGPNALVTWSAGPHVVLTQGLLEGLTLTELEAVVTHCLVRHATGESKRATAALGLGSVGTAMVRVGAGLDVRTVASTQYPPGLASAIRACEPQTGPHAALWFVAEGPTHASQEERAEALLDL